MNARVEWQPGARRALRKLPGDVAGRIVRAVDDFAATGHGDVKKLTDSRPPAYRLRVGDWRVKFGYDAAAADGVVLVVLAVANRREAY